MEKNERNSAHGNNWLAAALAGNLPGLTVGGQTAGGFKGERAAGERRPMSPREALAGRLEMGVNAMPGAHMRLADDESVLQQRLGLW